MSAVAPPPVQHPAPPRATVPVGTLTVGALLVLGGLVWLADEAGVVDVSWPVALALVGLAVGVLLLATVRSPHAGGLVPLGVVLSVLLALGSVLPAAQVPGGAGDRTYRPAAPAELSERYELGAGTLVLDLRALGPADVAGLGTEVSVGVGEIRVRLPEDLPVAVTAAAGTGEVDVLGDRREGLSPEVEHRTGGAPPGDVLVLDLQVGLGTVEVTR